MDPIRWGIVSTGRIAHKFADDFRFVTNGEMLAVASRSRENAEAFASVYGIPRSYGSYEALLGDPDIDAVYIGTPHTLHLQNAIDALDADKAVLCEKPLTTTADECKTLIHHAGTTNGYLMEAMWTYFLPAIQKAQQWVRSGRIGAIRHIKADFGYPVPYDPSQRHYDPKLAGGALLDMGIYPIALAFRFLGVDPVDIEVVGRRAPNGVDDDVVMVFNYENVVATLATSFRCRLQNSAYIIGEDGYIAIPDFWRARDCFLFHLDELIDHYVDDRVSLGYDFETVAVNYDLRDGKKQSDVVPLATSLKLQEHMDRVLAQL